MCISLNFNLQSIDLERAQLPMYQIKKSFPNLLRYYYFNPFDAAFTMIKWFPVFSRFFHIPHCEPINVSGNSRRGMSMREWIHRWDARTRAHNSRLYDTLTNAFVFFALHFARWRSTRYYLFCCRYSDIYHRFHGMRRRATGEHMPPRRGERPTRFN